MDGCPDGITVGSGPDGLNVGWPVGLALGCIEGCPEGLVGMEEG